MRAHRLCIILLLMVVAVLFSVTIEQSRMIQRYEASELASIEDIEALKKSCGK